MKKCPSIIKGFKNKLRWFFNGYSFELEYNPKESNLSVFAYHVYEILGNLRKRKYEHLVVKINDPHYRIKFIQAITNGKEYRVEFSVIDDAGKSHLMMAETKSHAECVDAFIKVLPKNHILPMTWNDISDETWNGEKILQNDNIINITPFLK